MSIPVQNPNKAHGAYTSRLGFESKEFDPDASLAIVVSRDDSDGTAILLGPYQGSFAESFQKSVFEANLPITVFAVENVQSELERMKRLWVKLRP